MIPEQKYSTDFQARSQSRLRRLGLPMLVLKARSGSMLTTGPASRPLLSFMPLIGNKVVEKDLRDWLQSHGYFGRSAQITELGLVAVRRPGWEQVFRFRVRAKRQEESDWNELTGILRDDERTKQFDVRLTTSEEDYTEAFAAWTEGMILQCRRTRGTTELSLIWLAVAVLIVAGAVAFIRRFL